MTPRLVIVTLCPGNPDSAEASFRYDPMAEPEEPACP